jgi:hypothetical protein
MRWVFLLRTILYENIKARDAYLPDETGKRLRSALMKVFIRLKDTWWMP